MLILILELRKTRLIPAMKRHVPSYANYLLLRDITLPVYTVHSYGYIYRIPIVIVARRTF